jgi:hypothetical protein
MKAFALLLALALPHRDVTSYPGLTQPSPGYLLTVAGANICSFRADAEWPSWCTNRWVMANDIDTRADIRAFAAKAKAHNTQVVWAPGYTSLDGYASRFGGVVVIQAQYSQCDPARYRRQVWAAVAAIAGRTPALAEVIYGNDGVVHCTTAAERSLRLVRPIVSGSFVLDFRQHPPGGAVARTPLH